jgi:hypothetical protein
VWTSDSGDNSVSEFIGIAAPAVMPLAAHTNQYWNQGDKRRINDS